MSDRYADQNVGFFGGYVRDLFAGSVAGSLATTVGYPLDTSNIRV
jgi:hypothetical protein